MVDVWWEESWEEKDSNLQVQLGTSSSHVFTNSVTNLQKKNPKSYLFTFLWGIECVDCGLTIEKDSVTN